MSKIHIKHPIGIQWKLPVARLRESIDSTDDDEYLGSDMFNIDGTDIRYYLAMHPNGDREDRRGQAWVFLYLEFDEPKEIKSQFSISIDSLNESLEREHDFKISHGHGGAICLLEDLLDPDYQAVVGEEIYVKLEGYLMVETDAPEPKPCILGSNENQMCINLWNQDIKDFKIVADGKEIQAHKCVLAAHSYVFEAMFKPHTKEAKESKVVIPDFSFNVVDAAIKFCYDSSLVPHVSFEEKMSLLKFFDKYDIYLLKDVLESCLISEVNVTNVCLLANLSMISNAANLRFKCCEFLQGCWKIQPVNDVETLDVDFVMDLLKNSLSHFSL